MQGFEVIEIIVDVENCLQVNYLYVFLFQQRFFFLHSVFYENLCSVVPWTNNRLLREAVGAGWGALWEGEESIKA